MNSDPILPAVTAPHPASPRIDAAAGLLGVSRGDAYLLATRAWLTLSVKPGATSIYTAGTLDCMLSVKPGTSAALVEAGLLEVVGDGGRLRAVVVKPQTKDPTGAERTRKYRERKRDTLAKIQEATG